jgi:serine phosphatase RsbU (regulator of sigma subunit)/CheY-like chemotaxis protein
MASVFAEELRGITSEQKREEVLTRLIQGMRKTIPAPSESKQKALLVDNDEEAVGMFKKVLFEEGFKVEVTSDGSEALKSVKERKPDIVVMDIRLTGKLSGMDVMRSLRPLKVPLILATRYVAFKSDFEFESYPKKEFLMKPFDEEQLRKAIRSLIPKKEQPEQTTEVTAFESGELSEAEKIQKSLLPRQLPQIAGFHLSVAYSPCLGVSGDYYDVISLGGNKYGVLLCDVSGKGISAAMVMVLVRTLFRTVAPWHDSPKATLLHLNTLLSKEMSEGMFVSGVYLVIDADTRTVSIANAGHCPPVFWAEERGNVEVQTLKMSGMVMGLVDATLFESKMNEGVFQVQPGVGIVLYSDGVTEAMNEKKQEFGEENLLEVVKKSAVYEPERLIANVYGALQMFRGSAPQSDDTTIVCIKCTG